MSLRDEFEKEWFPRHPAYNEPAMRVRIGDEYPHIGPTLAWRAYQAATERAVRIVEELKESTMNNKELPPPDRAIRCHAYQTAVRRLKDET